MKAGTKQEDGGALAVLWKSFILGRNKIYNLILCSSWCLAFRLRTTIPAL